MTQPWGRTRASAPPALWVLRVCLEPTAPSWALVFWPRLPGPRPLHCRSPGSAVPGGLGPNSAEALPRGHACCSPWGTGLCPGVAQQASKGGPRGPGPLPWLSSPGRLHLRQPVHNGLPVPLLPAWQVEATSQGPRSEGPCLPALGRSEMVGPGLCSPRYSCTARCEHAPGPALHPPRTGPQVEVLSKTCWWPRGLSWLRGPMQAAGCPGAAGAEGGAPIGGWRGERPSCGQTVGQRWAAGLGAWAPWGGGGASTGGTGFIPHGSWSGAEPWMLLAAPRCLMGGGCPEEVRTGFDCVCSPLTPSLRCPLFPGSGGWGHRTVPEPE